MLGKLDVHVEKNENIVLSGISQTEKEILYVLTCIWNVEKMTIRNRE